MTIIHRQHTRAKYSSQAGLPKALSSLKNAEISRVFIPAMNIIESKTAYNIEIELPGLKQNEIELQIDSHYFVLKGERKQLTAESVENILVNESSYGYFYRSFPLPEDVDVEQDWKAKLCDGILSIILPKLKNEKSMFRSIPIEGA